MFTSSVTLTASATGNYYLGVEYGQSAAKLSDSNQAITYPAKFGSVTDTYTLDKVSSSNGLVSLKGGYEFAGAQWRPAIAIGLGFYTTPTPYKYVGSVDEATSGGSPEKDYTYQFKLNSTSLLAETKFTWSLPHHVMPYVELGFGSAFNNLSGYTETATSASSYVTQPGFKSKNNTNFAYQMGLGVAYAFNVKPFNGNSDVFQHERVALGYRVANLGSANFNTRSADYPYALKLGKLTTSEIYLNFSHLF